MKATHEERPRVRRSGIRKYDPAFHYIEVHQPDSIVNETGRDQVDRKLDEGFELCTEDFRKGGSRISENTYILKKPWDEINEERAERTAEYLKMVNEPLGAPAIDHHGNSTGIRQVGGNTESLTDAEKAAIAAAGRAAQI